MGIPRSIVQGWLKKSDDAKPSARRVRHVQGRMNKTEERYAERLELMRLRQEIKWWKFESVKLRLADKTWYAPDFYVGLWGNGFTEIHEVKGFWEDDAKVKIKVAAELYPYFLFRTAQWDRKNQMWHVKEV